MNRNDLKHFACLATMLVSMNAVAGKPGGEPVVVDAVHPDSGEQGQSYLVVVKGNGFAYGATVHFLVAGSKDDSQITAGATAFVDDDDRYDGFDTLTTTIVIEPTALMTDYDVEVRAGKGRKGKGTVPLFKVLEGDSTVPNNEGSSIPMTCALNEEGNAVATLKHDAHLTTIGGPYYFSGVDKVGCQSGGVINPNLAGVRMSSFGPGNVRKAIRFVDVAFGTCIGGSACLPEEFLNLSGDVLTLDVRPTDAPNQNKHIHNLPSDTYPMWGAFWPEGFTERYKFEMDTGNIFGVRPLQSHACHNDAPGFIPGDSVNVYVWGDGVFTPGADGLPDGYTVTTGTISAPESYDALNGEGVPPVVAPGTMNATACANKTLAGQSCPSDKSRSALCHFLGRVPMRFTLHMQYE